MQQETFDLENALGFLMNRNGRMMAKLLHQKFGKRGFEVYGEKWPILVHLWIKDGVFQKELVDSICRDKGTIARTIQEMERENLLIRIEDEKDKRHKKIYLTHKGKELKKTLVNVAIETTKEATEGISDEEIKVCKIVLKKIYNNLNK